MTSKQLFAANLRFQIDPKQKLLMKQTASLKKVLHKQ
jgi:hypothetical protein